ncbi:hypothetical protein MPER_08122, partial [Moniliophthora perniciosa FA553]
LADIYLGKAASGAAPWDGTACNWFKVRHAKPQVFSNTHKGLLDGAEFEFIPLNGNRLTTTIPSNVPDVEHLVRIIVGSQYFIPVHKSKSQAEEVLNPPKRRSRVFSVDLTVNIYYSIPTSYTVPGPAPFQG